MAKSNEELQAELRSLQAKLKKSETALKVAEATKPKNAKPLVEKDGKHYEVLAGERTKSGTLTAKELAQDIKRCHELINNGSGLFREVNISK